MATLEPPPSDDDDEDSDSESVVEDYQAGRGCVRGAAELGDLRKCG